MLVSVVCELGMKMEHTQWFDISAPQDINLDKIRSKLLEVASEFCQDKPMVLRDREVVIASDRMLRESIPAAAKDFRAIFVES